MLQMIFSKPGGGKTFEIHKAIKERYDNGLSNMIMLVPEQVSFESEREILKIVGAPGMDKIDVLSFSRFADRFFEKYGGRDKRRIDEIGKTALMQLTLKKLRPTLSIFSKQCLSSAFCDSMISLDTQMKRFGVTASDMQSLSTKKSGILKNKLYETSLILSEFNELLNNEYYDPLDDLTKIYERLSSERYFENRSVFLDSFNGFTAQQLNIVKMIISQADEVFISFSFDKNAQNTALSLYKNVGDTVTKLRGFAKSAGVKICPDIFLSKYSRHTTPELKFLTQNAFMPDKQKYDKEISNLHLARVRTIYDECSFVASNIRRLNIEKNIRYREIAVICRDTAKYSGIIEQAFAEYDIPLFIDAKKPATGTAIIRFAINALLGAKSFSSENILAMLKSGITFANADEVMLLDDYVTVWSIHGDDWTREFTGNPRGMGEAFTDDDKAALVGLNNLRNEIISPLTALQTALKKGGAKNISAALYQFIIDTKANVKLNEYCENLSKGGDNTAADVQRRAYDMLVSVLDQLCMALDGYEIDYKRFIDAFINVVNSCDIGKLPQALDEVAIGSAERMRPKSPKVTFIIGAVNGEFPAVFGGNGVFSDRELTTLKNDGLELALYDEQRAIDENYLAFLSMCSPSEQLFVSYYGKGNDNETNYPSAIVTEIMSIFDIEPKNESFDKIEDIYSKKSALRLICRENGANSDKSSALQYFKEYDNDEYLKMSAINRQNPTEISPENAVGLFGKNLHLSASRVDMFYHCSFSYFCKYGLKISPIRKADIDSLQRGTVVHLVLCRFIEKYKPDEYMSLEKNEKYNRVREIVNEALADYLSSKTLSQIDKTNLGFLYRQCANILDYIYEDLLQTNYSVSGVEVSFGNGEDDDFESVEIKLPSGGKAIISGKIDRVDSFVKDGVKYVRVIDYKTGTVNFSLSDVVYGLNLQMLFYLCAYKKQSDKKGDICVPAGVLYAPVKDKSVFLKTRETTKDKVYSERRKTLKLNGIALDDETSLTAMEPKLENIFTPVKAAKSGEVTFSGSRYAIEQFGILNDYIDKLIVKMGKRLQDGDIKIDPTDGKKGACDYCDYASVCQHEGECQKVISHDDEENYRIMEEEERL